MGQELVSDMKSDTTLTAQGPWHFSRTVLVPHVVAVACVTAAVVLRLLLNPWLAEHYPFATLFLAVFVAGWYGGFGPAVTATVAGLFVAQWYLLYPREASVLTGNMQQVGLLLYLAVSLSIASLGGGMHTARRRAEQLLAGSRQRQDQLRATLHSIGDAVIVTDATANIVTLNPVAQRLTGWTAAEATGLPLTQVYRVIHELTREPLADPVPRVLAEGSIVGLSKRSLLTARDGTVRPIDDNAAPIRDAQGQPQGVVVVFRDVSERRRADEDRRRLAAIVESSEDAIVGKTLDGIILSWNAGAERLYGYTAAEMIGQSFMVLVPPDRSAETTTCIQRLRQGEPVTPFETVRRRKDGSLIDVSVSYSPIKDQEGRGVGMAVIARDISERKRSEQAIRDRERQLRFVTDNAPVLIAHCDAQRRFKFVNKPYAERFGRQPHDLIGKSIAEVVGDEAFAVIAPHIATVLSGQRVKFEAEIPYRDLGTQHMLCAFAPEVDAEGQVVGYVAAVTNITERKRMEQALAEEARINETLHRVGTALAAQLDLEKIVQTVTDEATALTEAQFGAFFYNVRNDQGEAYTLFTLSGVPRSAFANFPMPRNTAIFESTFRGEGVLRLDDVTQDPRYGQNLPYDGMPPGHLPVRSYLAAPVVSRSGEVLGGLFFGHDRPGVFTARAERLVVGLAAQAAIAIDNARLYGQLQQSEERLRLALDAGRMGVWDWNLLTNQIKWTENLEPMHGLVPGTFQGNFAEYEQIVHPDDLDRLRQAITRAMGGEETYDLEFRVFWPDGTVHWILGKGKVLNEDGRPVRLVGVALDITGRKETEEALKDAHRRKDEFLALLGHELRNPLAPIRNALQIMKLPGTDAASVARAREIMERQFQQLVHLVDDLLDVSRIMRGRIELRRQPLELAAVVARAVETVQPVIDAEGHELILSLPTEPIRIDGDLVRLAQVVGNLLSNSAKYTDPGGRIEVVARVEGRVASEEKKGEVGDGSAVLSRAQGVASGDEPGRTVLSRDQELSQGGTVRLDQPDSPSSFDTGQHRRGARPAPHQGIPEPSEHRAGITPGSGNAFAAQSTDRSTQSNDTGPALDDGGRDQPDALRASAGAGGEALKLATHHTPRATPFAVIRVRDTGIGMAPDALDRVFDMFYQAERRTTNAQGGLGIGLSLVRALVELHGGTVQAFSDGPGKGSEFVVRLPLLIPGETEQGTKPTSQAAEEKPAPRRVLVVDDGTDAADSLAMLLQLDGQEVYVAYDGPSALVQAEAYPPAIAFLDLGMPRMDGYELARRLREHPALRRMVLVAVTGWGQPEDRQRTREAGFDHHLVKPVEPVELQKILGALPASGSA
jgi:PAS domain S-box-containing protein